VTEDGERKKRGGDRERGEFLFKLATEIKRKEKGIRLKYKIIDKNSIRNSISILTCQHMLTESPMDI